MYFYKAYSRMLGGGVLAEMDGIVPEDEFEILFFGMSHIYNVENKQEEE